MCSKVKAKKFVVEYMDAYNNGLSMHEFSMKLYKKPPGCSGVYSSLKRYLKMGIRLPKLAPGIGKGKSINVTELNKLIRQKKTVKR